MFKMTMIPIVWSEIMLCQSNILAHRFMHELLENHVNYNAFAFVAKHIDLGSEVLHEMFGCFRLCFVMV